MNEELERRRRRNEAATRISATWRGYYLRSCHILEDLREHQLERGQLVRHADRDELGREHLLHVSQRRVWLQEKGGGVERRGRGTMGNSCVQAKEAPSSFQA